MLDDAGTPPGEDEPAPEGAAAPRLWGALRSPRARLVARVLRGVVMASVVGLLVWQLREIGWRAVWANLPVHPGFYLLFAVLYFQVTVGEIVAYRLCWDFDVRASLRAFLLKRIYNRDVLGYAGEVYFFGWARRHVGLPAVRVAETIRDQNIVSSIASTAIAVGLLIFYAINGGLEVSYWLRDQVADVALAVWIGGAVALVVAGALIVRYRRFVFSTSLKIAAAIFLLHVVRLIFGQGVQILQWELGAPEGTLEMWFTLSAASIIAARIPLLPGRDLLFVSAGVALSDAMSGNAAAISGILLVNAVLGKVLSLALFVALGVRKDAPASDAAPRVAPIASGDAVAR
ncbi:MAG: hypothetical protein R3A79_07990 [Nannocystaceae bacterium]